VPGVLYQIDDGKKVRHFLLPQGCAIGRRPNKHLIAVADNKVSMGHAWIDLREEGWWISDQGSSSGTFVNDRRVMSQGLRSGDVLRCGDTTFRFEATPPVRPTLAAGLLCFSSDGLAQTVWLHPEGTMLGSLVSLNIYADDPSLARTHAMVCFDGVQFVVLPLTPGYPVKLSGHEVSEKGTRLRSGDLIECGSLQVRFALLSGTSPQKTVRSIQAALRACPTEAPALFSQPSSLLSGGSSMLAAPSGLSAQPSGLSTKPTAKLRYKNDKQQVQVVEIPETGAYLGRALECLVRSEDISIPRRWGRIFFRDGRFFFEDLGSSSPSFVNGEQQFPHVPRELKNGDLVVNRVMEVLFVSEGLLSQGTTVGFVKQTPVQIPLSGALFLQLTDDGDSRQFPIPKGGALLGRSRGCLLTTDDARVSRQHARVWHEGEVCWIEDLSKEYGTWLSGERLLGEKRPLQTGDLVRLGTLRARYVGPDAQFAHLDEQYRPFRVRCPIGKIGPIDLYFADHPELQATVVLKVLSPNAKDHARWLSVLSSESRLLRIHAPSSPAGGTLLRALPDGQQVLAAPLGCGLLLTEFLGLFGTAPLPLVLELLGQLLPAIERLTQTDSARQEGQLPVREVWFYTDPLAPLGLAARLLPQTSLLSARPSPILQAPETGLANGPKARQGQVYVYGLLLYALASGNLPSFSAPRDKLLSDIRPVLPALLTDWLAALLLEKADRRPDPSHAQRWLADLRSVYANHRANPLASPIANPVANPMTNTLSNNG